MQPNPAPFWASRLFRWNLVFLAVVVAAAAFWMLVLEPKMSNAELEKMKAEYAAKKYVPRDPAAPGPREVRFDGMLDRVKDDVDPDVKDEPYRYLVKHLATMDPAKLGEQARYVDYELLMKRPEEVRGVTTRLQLLFWKTPSGPVRLEPAVGGVETVTRAYLAESRTPKEVYFVDFVEAPADIEKETPVVVDAVFLRRVKYERADRPGQFHEAPLFVARSVAKVQDAPRTGPYKFLPVAILIGIATFAFLLFLFVKTFIAARSGGPPAPPRRIPG
jgi:hypothetical protein